MSTANQSGRPHSDHGILTEATSSDIAQVERRARKMVESLAVENLEGVSRASQVDVRDLIPSEDLDSGDDNGWTTGTRAWEQTGLTADQFEQTYSVDGDTGNAEDKIVVIFGMKNLAANPATTEVRFESNTGGVFERLQVEGMLTDQEVFGLIADPIVNINGKITNIEQYVTETSDNLVFVGAVAEKAGKTLEESSRFMSAH